MPPEVDAHLQTGSQPHPPEPAARSEGAGGTSEAARDPHQELVSVLQQRQQQIQAARGDLNLFRAVDELGFRPDARGANLQGDAVGFVAQLLSQGVATTI